MSITKHLLELLFPLITLTGSLLPGASFTCIGESGNGMLSSDALGSSVTKGVLFVLTSWYANWSRQARAQQRYKQRNFYLSIH
jgi:hypothetical protein